MDWLEIKNWLETASGLDRDALHIYGAVGIQLITAFVLKRSLASPLPWLLVLLAVLLNEYSDFQRAGDSAASIAIYTESSIHDIWNTMLFPTVFLILARFAPGVMTQQPQYFESESNDAAQSDAPR